MEFKNLTGDSRAVRQLEIAVSEPENILLTGVMGTAKKDILRLAAKKLLCRGDKTEACTCASCVRMLDYHPDFKMVLPEGGVIRKEQVDSIVENAREMPQISDVKVFLISGGDKMNASAANALLKVLEDSGRNIFFITADGEVLNTISSRCRVIKLKAVLPEIDLGAEREMINMACDGRIEYVQDFKKDGFFKKLYAFKELLYTMKNKVEILEFFNGLKEKDKEEFYASSTAYERDAVLRLMSRVYYMTLLDMRGIMLPEINGSEAIARLYADEDIVRISDAISNAYKCHMAQSYTKNDWFMLMTELTR